MAFKKGKYQHYKGAYYQVLDVVIHSETEQRLILYKPLYMQSDGKQQLWVRPYEMFFEEVNISGQQIPRFRYVEQ